MKKSINIFFCLLLLVLFAGCSDLNSELGMCNIKIDCVGNGTATVESEKVPLGTIIKVTTIPDEGYYAYRVDSGSYGATTQDKKDKNIYYVYVYCRDLNIRVNFSRKSINSIYKISGGHGQITVNPTSAYEGQKVEVTLTPDYGYYPKNVKVEDVWGNPVPVVQDETDLLKYTFIMPDQYVDVCVDFDSFVFFNSSQDKIKEGDVVSFSVNNYSDFSSCDLYISYSTESEKEFLESNVDFSGGMYKFTAKEGGTVTLYAKNPAKKELYHKLTSFIVEIPDLPTGWENISCHISEKKENVYKDNKLYKPVTIITESPSYRYPYYEYYYASDPENKVKRSRYVGYGSCDIEFELSYEKNDFIYFRFYDENNKIMSRTAKIEIPVYPEEPKTSGTKTLDCFIVLDIYPSIFKDSKTTIEVDEASKEYFSVSKDKEKLIISSKKTTGKEWEVNVKNSSGESLSKIMVKIPYSGTPEIRIVS